MVRDVPNTIVHHIPPQPLDSTVGVHQIEVKYSLKPYFSTYVYFSLMWLFCKCR